MQNALPLMASHKKEEKELQISESERNNIV
jgi:hypothetical protein